MKRLIFLITCILVVGLSAACASPATLQPTTPSPSAILPTSTPSPSAILPTSTPSPSAILPTVTPQPVPSQRLSDAQQVVDLFLKGEDAALLEKFDKTMQTAFPAEKMQAARLSLATQVGDFKQSLGTRAEKVQGYDIVWVTCEFEKMSIEFRVVFDPQGLVAGFFMKPAENTPQPAYVAPSYVKMDAFREQEVTIGSGEWQLPGTLSIPNGSGPFPAVALVHGSGPNDRDETIGPNKPFRDLAWGLASQGIAVLRYEKRTRQYPAQMAALADRITVKEETVDDALAAVALLRQTDGIDPAKIFVLGHSLGGMLLPRIGAADPLIAGLISLAGPARPLEDITLEQITYILQLDGTISEAEQVELDKLATQVATVKSADFSTDLPSDQLPLNIPANYWLDLRGYHPAETAKNQKIPMLLLQGERDYQVTTADFDLWKAALSSRADVQFELYPDLNHLFITGVGKSTPDEYENVGHVAEQVIMDIAKWILP